MPDVILPVLDEAAALPWVLARMPAGFHPLVVDNGSTDSSAQVARAAGAVVLTEARRGFGAACFAGLLAANSDVVCFMDGDGSLDPRCLPSVARAVMAGQADLVIGERVPVPGAWPWHARMANRALARRVRRRTGVRLRDLGPMRAAGRDALLRLALRDRRFGWPLEMVVQAARSGWRIEGVPVPYTRRAGGRSKVTGTVGGTARAIRDMSAVFRRVESGRRAEQEHQGW